MIKKNSKFLWRKVCNTSTDLFLKKQITRKLYRMILEANYEDQTYIRFLMSLTEDCMRIKGYYNNNARIEACDNAIDNALDDYERRLNNADGSN